jgi:hypothetical protein
VQAKKPEPACYTSGCAQAAAFVCAFCGKPCCAQHVRHVQIERRDDPEDTAKARWSLIRTPSHTATYALCVRCAR